MNNDVFIEYLVKKRKTALDYLIQIGSIIGGLVLIWLSFLLTPYLGALSILSTFAIVALIYGIYFVVTGVNTEYEYILTNGELDIDKIIAQRKRKRLITVKCKDFETFGRYTPQAHIPQDVQTRHIVCDSTDSPDVYYCTVRHPSQGNTLIIFNLNEKLAQNMKKFIPRSVRGSELD